MEIFRRGRGTHFPAGCILTNTPAITLDHEGHTPEMAEQRPCIFRDLDVLKTCATAILALDCWSLNFYA